VAVDPLDIFEGENVTAKMDSNGGLTITSLGDFYTEEDEYVPVWVYCDDDPQVNTHTEGENPGFVGQEINFIVEPVNDEPIWHTPIGEIHVNEDGLSTETPSINLLTLPEYASDVETPSDQLEYEITMVEPYQVVGMKIEPEDLSLNLISLKKDWVGTINVELLVSDGEEEEYTQFQVKIDPVNDAPTLGITSHKDGDTVEGLINIQGTANDIEKKLANIEVSMDDGQYSDVTQQGVIWKYTIDTTLLDNGEHKFSFRCFDQEGLESEVVPLNLKVNNPINEPPTIQPLYPEDGSEIRGGVQISGMAFDLVSVTNVSVKINEDGIWQSMNLTSENGSYLWEFFWSTVSLTDGDYTLHFRSYDGELFSSVVFMNYRVNNTIEVEDYDDTHGDPINGGSKGDRGSISWFLWIIIIITSLRYSYPERRMIRMLRAPRS